MNKTIVLFIAAAAASSHALASSIVDYTVTAGTTQTLSAAYDLNGITASATGGQLERTNGGLGLIGGAADYLIDGAESVKFTFDAGTATSVSFEADLIINLDFSKVHPAASLTGYGAGGASLGTFAFAPFSQLNGITNLSNYFGATPLSGFSISGNQTGVAIAKITYTAPLTATPEPATMLMAGAGLLAFAAFRAKRSGLPARAARQ